MNMKRIITILIALLTMTTISSQTLTERQKGLAACACLMAQGNLERLEPAVRMALVCLHRIPTFTECIGIVE